MCKATTCLVPCQVTFSKEPGPGRLKKEFCPNSTWRAEEFIRVTYRSTGDPKTTTPPRKFPGQRTGRYTTDDSRALHRGLQHQRWSSCSLQAVTLPKSPVKHLFTSCTRHGLPRHTLVIRMLGELNKDGDWNMGNAVGGDSGCCLWALRDGSSLPFSFISVFCSAHLTLDSHWKPQLSPPGVLRTDVLLPGKCPPHLVFILCPFPSEVPIRSFV